MKKAVSGIALIVALFILINTLSSCKKASQTPTTTVSLNGNWTGASPPTNPNPYNYQAGTISMALTQSGSGVTGTFTFLQNVLGGTGSVSGNITGTNLNLTLQMTSPTSPNTHLYTINLDETVNAGYTVITGTYHVYIGSSNFEFGTYDANKQ